MIGLLLAQTGTTINSTEIKSPLRPELSNVSGIMSTIISFLLPLALVILFGMLIAAGFTFMTAQGKAEKVKKAKAMIISSLIGIFLLFSSFFLVRVLARIFGLDGGGILP